MSFSPHISASISQGYGLIRNITGIRKYISREHLKTLVNSIIIAKFDNCNSLYVGISAFEAAYIVIRLHTHRSIKLDSLDTFVACHGRLCGNHQEIHVADLANDKP